MQRVIEYIEQNRDRYLQELNEFLVIPSISNDPQKKGDVGRAAEFVASQLRNAGMSRVEIFSTPGHPIVFAERIEDSLKPTVLIYAHYDVQPVDPLDLWTTPPFEPAIRDNRIYARGAADDKGQMMIHFKSVEALMQIRGKLPVNVKFLVEGEEEIGSPSLDGGLGGGGKGKTLDEPCLKAAPSPPSRLQQPNQGFLKAGDPVWRQ